MRLEGSSEQSKEVGGFGLRNTDGEFFQMAGLLLEEGTPKEMTQR